MLLFQRTISQGLQRALRHWYLLLPLYLWNVLLGLLQTWPLFVIMSGGGLYNPFLGDLASGSADALVNLFLGSAVDAGTAALWVFAVLPLTALFGMAYNLFSGGILSVYASAGPFWAGCRRMFWTFTALGGLLVLMAGLVVMSATFLARLLGGSAAFVLAFLALQCVGMLGEYARAIAVARDRRNPFALLSMAVRFCIRWFGGALALALLGLLLHVALAAAYTSVAPMVMGLSSQSDGSPAIILLQQLALLAWLWIKLLRLAWAMSYVQASGEARTSPGQAPSAPIVVS